MIMTKQTYPPRIMYIECKGGGFTKPYAGWDIEVSRSGGLQGTARIGRVTFSRTGATLHYRGKSFQSLKGSGFKANYFDVETGEQMFVKNTGLRSESSPT
jgi:hypothetical protein